MNLISAFEKNLINGLDVLSPDRTIETIISKIFFYGDKVFKIYKYKKFFFGDFSSDKFRADFYKEDFYWNNIMAPEVYVSLCGVKKASDKYQIVDLGFAEDFFIEMKKFDDQKNLTNLLFKKEISKDILKNIVIKMVSRLEKLTDNKREKYKEYFDRDFLEGHQEDLESDRNLLYMIQSFVPKERVDKIIDAAKKFSIKNKYFQNYNKNDLSILIDNHADNIVLLNDEVEFIDVLPPKESWRIGDLHFNVCRLATDVSVLNSQELAESVYGTYEKNFKIIPTEVKYVYEIRSALIQAWCFYSAKKADIANNYLKFAENRAFLLV